MARLFYRPFATVTVLDVYYRSLMAVSKRSLSYFVTIFRHKFWCFVTLETLHFFSVDEMYSSSAWFVISFLSTLATFCRFSTSCLLPWLSKFYFTFKQHGPIDVAFIVAHHLGSVV